MAAAVAATAVGVVAIGAIEAIAVAEAATAMRAGAENAPSEQNKAIARNAWSNLTDNVPPKAATAHAADGVASAVATAARPGATARHVPTARAARTRRPLARPRRYRSLAQHSWPSVAMRLK